MKFQRLLAKSLKYEQSEVEPKTQSKARKAAFYTGHIAAVMQSANVLIEQLGATILQRLGLENIAGEHFASTVRLAAYLHDWGKANQHFQEMVYLKSEGRNPNDEKVQKYKKMLQKSWREHNEKQMLRHEVILLFSLLC